MAPSTTLLLVSLADWRMHMAATLVPTEETTADAGGAVPGMSPALPDRWAGITRPYTAADVERRRPPALGASHDAGFRPGVRRAERQPGGANGSRGARGDLRERLAGRRRCQPRRANAPRSKPVPGELGPGARYATQHGAPSRRSDP